MIRVYSFLAFLILMASLYSCSDGTSNSTQFSNENDLLKYGKSVYENHCIFCHGPKGNSKIAQSADLTLSKMSETEITDLVFNGRKTMPRFAEVLGEPEISAVAKYVLSLKASQ